MNRRDFMAAAAALPLAGVLPLAPDDDDREFDVLPPTEIRELARLVAHWELEVVNDPRTLPEWRIDHNVSLIRSWNSTWGFFVGLGTPEQNDADLAHCLSILERLDVSPLFTFMRRDRRAWSVIVPRPFEFDLSAEWPGLENAKPTRKGFANAR